MNFSQNRIDEIYCLYQVALSAKDVQAIMEAVFNEGHLAGIRTLRERHDVSVLDAKNLLYTMLRNK